MPHNRHILFLLALSQKSRTFAPSRHRIMEKNSQLRTAWDFVENTGISIFLTGKAGTGKTTFLREVCKRSPKRKIVVAPTGVAAINAGGMTIHSFFQLPLTPYVPSAAYKERFDFSKEKRSIIRTLDLLIIDEISMVRSDLLDAIDNIMRRFRDPQRPFGGVQLLLIGDLQQLTPVVTAEEEALLREYYDTPYFFGSHALQKTPYVTIQLSQVYRQQDETFLNILNHIREGRPTRDDLDKLNARRLPPTQFGVHGGTASVPHYIRLTTHNRLADAYNEEALLKIREPIFRFTAQIDGTFPEYAYPTDVVLTLKLGAQVMFIKNDTSAEHRFYNGRIGRISKIDDKHISVRCEDDDSDIDVEPLQWENAKYELNDKTKEIEAHVQGTFTQYPLRLAWAITIHKSQGLTFDHAIIDAGKSFAAGQVYVALSRCRTLDGLLLATPISASNIFGDQRVATYIAQEEQEAQRSIEALPQLKEAYYRELLRELFDFTDFNRKYATLRRQLDEHFYTTYPRLCAAHRQTNAEFQTKVIDVSRKWAALIAQMPLQQLHEAPFLERTGRSTVYFLNTLTDLFADLLEKTVVETDNKQVVRRTSEALADLRQSYAIKTSVLAAVAAEGFSMKSYLRQKQHATLDALGELSDKKKRERKPRSPKSRDRKTSALTSAKRLLASEGTAAAPVVSSDIQNKPLYEALRNWRWEKSKQLNLPPYTILQQKALIGIVNALPRTLRELIAIPYFGKQSADKYGAEILDVVSQHLP